MKKSIFVLSAFLLLSGGIYADRSSDAVPGTIPAQGNEARLLRFPDIKGDKVAFSYAGDIYIVNSNGGTARRPHPTLVTRCFQRYLPMER